MSVGDWFSTRILVVDDNERVRDAMCMRIRLSSESYKVRGVGSGRDALQCIEEDGYDIVLCDLVLAGEPDGISTTREIREQYPGTRVVVFSGVQTGERKIEVLKAGAFSYLSKPINHEELLHAIETINSIRRTERLGEVFRTLARISHELQMSLDFDYLAGRIVRGACELGYRRSRLYLYDGEHDRLIGKAACGMDDDEFEGYEIPLEDPMISEIFNADRPMVWNERLAAQRWGEEATEPWMSRLGLHGLTWIDIPLLVGNERVGTLAVDNGPGHQDPGGGEEPSYTAEDLEGLDVFAGMAAHALNNAQLYEKEALANASLSSILHEAPDAVITTDLEGIVTFVSPSGERVTGHRAEKMLGRPAHEFYTDPEMTPGAGLAAARRLMARLWAEGTVSSLRIDLRPPSGQPRPASISASLLHDDKGEAIGTLGIVKELGGLEAQTEQYRNVLEGFGYGTLLLSRRLNVQFVNQKALRLLKRTRDETVGRRFAELILPAQRQEFGDVCHQVLTGNKEAAFDFSVLRGDENRLAISTRLTPVRSHRGVNGVAVALYDKGELGALIQSGRLMALGQMVAGVAHEVNNPLNNMLVASRETENRLRRHGLQSEKVDKYLDMIERNGRRIQDIVRQLRDFARPSSFERAPIAVNQVVDDALAFFRTRFHRHAIELELELAEGLPEVLGDSNRLQQVLINLVVNAEDAMAGQTEPKRIAIASRLAGEMMEITVSDNGCGVPDEIMEAIFDPFFTTKAPNQGTGLGLSISKSIMDMHDGGIRARRGPDGRGTTFILTLPVA